ncbi:MAG: hypothetical protein HQL40_08300 [Alphaproteobacteria bacterium]|nr:hypothetical protein [Alphaproteobacteria bacterium]
MLYPRASICIIDLTDEELNALAESVGQERHRRDVQRRAEQLLAEEHTFGARASSLRHVETLTRQDNPERPTAPRP